MLEQADDNLYPVDSTYYDCCRGIGGHGPDCPQLALDRLRSAVVDVNPALLGGTDIVALLDLMKRAYRSDSEWGQAARANDAIRKAGQ